MEEHSVKRIISLVLTFILVWSSGVFSATYAYAQTVPRLVEKGEGYELRKSADGKNVLRFAAEDSGFSGDPVAWRSDSRHFSAGGGKRSLSMNRVYEKGEMLLSDTFGDIGISFAPLMNDEADMLEIEQSVVDAALQSVPKEENQSAPLSIIVGIFPRVSTLLTQLGLFHNPFSVG